MPITPMPVSASLTSSSLNGLMIASIFFITVLPSADNRATAVPRLVHVKRAISVGSVHAAGAPVPKVQASRARLPRLRAMEPNLTLGPALRDVVLAHLRVQGGAAQAEQGGRRLLVPAGRLEGLEDGRALDLF